MKQFLFKLLTLGLFLLSVGCFYAARTLVFSSAFINIALFVVAIFVLFEACGNADRLLGYGKYSKSNKKNPPRNEDNQAFDNANSAKDEEE